MANRSQLAPLDIWTNAPAPSTRPVVKTGIQGLMPRTCNATNAPIARYADGSLVGIVVNVDWSDIQPSNGGAVNLAAASEWVYYRDTLTPANCGGTRPPCRLRIHMGSSGPTWAKNLNGGPLNLFSSTGAAVTCGLWWKASYLAAWDDLAAKLATNITSTTVDGVAYTGIEAMPFLVELAAHPATTSYVEPCQRAIAFASNRQAYVTAGLAGSPDGVNPDPLDAAALLYPASRWLGYGFTTTPQLFSWNPFQQWTSSGGVQVGQAILQGWTAATAMPQVVTAMLSRVTLSNNSLRAPVLKGLTKYGPVYDAQVSLKGAGVLQRNSHQTATLSALQTTYQGASPAPPTTTQGDALLATAQVAAGIIFTPGNDPYALLSNPTGLGSPFAFRSSSFELPDTWASAKLGGGATAMTTATCLTLNAAFAANYID